MSCSLFDWVKALPHNSSAALAMPFLPSASCRNLDLPPVNLRFLQSHLTKNAFAIAPTHLCGIALSNKKPEKKTQSSDKNQRQEWRNRRCPADDRGLRPFSLPSGSMEKTSSTMPISIESEKTTQRNHFRSGKKSDILDKTQFLCIIKLLHHPFHRPPRR